MHIATIQPTQHILDRCNIQHNKSQYSLYIAVDNISVRFEHITTYQVYLLTAYCINQQSFTALTNFSSVQTHTIQQPYNY